MVVFVHSVWSSLLHSHLCIWAVLPIFLSDHQFFVPLLNGKVSWNNENPVDYHQKHQAQYQVPTAISPNDTMHQQCSSLTKTLPSLVQLGTLDLDNHHLLDCVILRNSPQGWKIRFSGKQNSMLLKASTGACCAPRNFVLLVTLQGLSVCFTE